MILKVGLMPSRLLSRVNPFLNRLFPNHLKFLTKELAGLALDISPVGIKTVEAEVIKEEN